MKKIAVIIFCLLIFIISIVPVSAVSNKYTIEELGLSVSIPEKYLVITRETSDNSSVFDKIGKTRAEAMTELENNSIYLDAFLTDGSEEIVVTMTDGTISDFNVLSDTTLKGMISILENQYKEYNIEVSKYDIYQHSQAKFVRLFFNNSDNSFFGVQYYTTYNKKAMNFTLRSYSGKVTSAQEKIIKNVVDSVKYDTKPQEKEDIQETESYVYTDKDTNVTYTVPDNWQEKALSEKREFIDVKYVSNKEEGLTILYGSTDFWAGLTESEKKGYNRASFNNDVFTIDEMALLFGVQPSEVEKVTYNGTSYYMAEVTGTAEVYGVDMTTTVTHAIHIENGWYYWFQFGAEKSSEYFSDFEKLLNSVEYPVNSIIDNSVLSIEDGQVDIKVWNIILGFILTISIYSLPIIIYRYKIRRYPVADKKAKIITILYAIGAFVVTALVIRNVPGSSPILLWSFMNYRILTTPSKRDIGLNYTPLEYVDLEQKEFAEETIEQDKIEKLCQENDIESIEETEEIADTQNIAQQTIEPILNNSQELILQEQQENPKIKTLFCRKCGTRLIENCEFCHKCGMRVHKGE